MPSLRLTTIIGLLVTKVAAQQHQPEQPQLESADLVLQLAGEDSRVLARTELVKRGGASVEPLLQGLDNAVSLETQREILGVLAQLGPAAGPAAPDLVPRVLSVEPPLVDPLLTTISELVPYRPEGSVITSTDLERALSMRRGKATFTPERAAILQRFRARAAFPRLRDVEFLRHAVRGRRPYRVELAIELLAQHDAAAADALPELVAILDQPDPRVPCSSGRVPLRAAAMVAIERIAPDASIRAKHTDGPAATRQPTTMPAAARARLDEIVKELGSEDTRRVQDALSNLQAYGSMAVPPLLEALRNGDSQRSRSLTIRALRAVGPGGASAIPELYELLTELPAAHTFEVLQTITALAPWARDVVVFPCPSVGGPFEIFGQRIARPHPDGFRARLENVRLQLFPRTLVDRDATVGELIELLDHPNSRFRSYALEILRERAASARAALPALRTAMRSSHPASIVYDVGTSRLQELDMDPEIQRRAARAILAIAPDHADEARAVLERLGR